jgi:hypothetical protein
MKIVLCVLLLLILPGCATRPAWLENRVACTLDRAQLYALSIWGPLSIGSRIADADAAVACRVEGKIAGRPE